MAYRSLRLAAFATAPLVLISLLFWFSALNPMTRAFADALDVVNDTEELIEVTPIGSNRRGRTTLTQLSTGRLALPVLRSAHSIPPRSSVTITYDGDDDEASDLVIQGPTGSPRWLALAEYPTGSPRQQAANPRLVIKSLSALPSAPDALLDVARAAGREKYWLLGAHFGFVVPVLLWLASRRAARTPEKAAHPPQRSASSSLSDAR